LGGKGLFGDSQQNNAHFSVHHAQFFVHTCLPDQRGIVGFVDLLVLLKICDMIQWIGTPELHVISMSGFWGVL